MPRSRRSQARQRGAIIVWFALFMMTMLSFAALGIDVAKLAATRTQLQNAADAAALAGASALDPATGLLIPEQVVGRAQQAGLGNEAFIDESKPITIPAADVSVLPDNVVKVTTRRQGESAVITTIAQVLGIKTLETTATAWAKVDTAESICMTAPIGIMPPQWGERFETGRTYMFKFGTAHGGDGNYRPLLLPPCLDGPCAGMDPYSPQTFECQMKNNYRCCISMKEWVFLQRAAWTGPVKKGIDDRFDGDTDQRQGITHAEYRGNGSRMLYVPITSPEVSGDAGVWVTGMAAFFVKSRVGNGVGSTLVGEFVHAIVPGTPVAPGPHEPTNSMVFTVHLVKEPT